MGRRIRGGAQAAAGGAVLVMGYVVLLKISDGGRAAWAIAHHLPLITTVPLMAAAIAPLAAHSAVTRASLPQLGARQAFLLTHAPAAASIALDGRNERRRVTHRLLEHWEIPLAPALSAFARSRRLMATLTAVLAFAGWVVLAVTEHLPPALVQVLLALGAVALLIVLIGAAAWLLRTLERVMSDNRPMARSRDVAPLLRRLPRPARRIGLHVGFMGAATYAAFLVPLFLVQRQVDDSAVGLLEAMSVFAVAQPLAAVPGTRGGLVVVDGALMIGLYWIGIPAHLALAVVMGWRATMVLPQLVVGLLALGLWRRSVREGGAGLGAGEPWVGRVMHRAAFVVLSASPWRKRVLRGAFDAVHRRDDPWAYGTSPYEHAKAEEAVAVTADLRIRSILEVGCSDGHLADRLLQAHPQAHLLAVDISPQAVTTARQTLAEHAGRARVEVADMAQVSQLPHPEEVDLVVLSEVLYYLGGDRQLRRNLRSLTPLLSPRAYLLLVHPTADAPRLHTVALTVLGMRRVSETSAGDRWRPVTITFARRIDEGGQALPSVVPTALGPGARGIGRLRRATNPPASAG